MITLKWWGRPTGFAVLPRAARPARDLHRRVRLPPRARHRRSASSTIAAPETPDHAADLRGRLTLANERLDAGDTFVFVHLKATDEAGHTKDPRVKQRTIEELDAELLDLPTDRAIVCVTGDHCTPASPEVIHSGDPVPFILAGPGVRADAARRLR